MKEHVHLGLIQPVINPDTFWNSSPVMIARELAAGHPKPHYLNIAPIFAEAVWQQILEGLRQLLKGNNKPDMILIPELHVPPSKLNELKSLCAKSKTIAIAGLDFLRSPHDSKKIRNTGVLIIPGTIGTAAKKHSRITTLHFGKTYFSHTERQMFTNINGELDCKEDPEQNMYIFQTSDFGNFGIMICSDIFDIERMMLYQTRIHHLIIISLNKDLNTYFALAETLTRLLYCNVVICNTGFYGGSLGFSPYKDVNERTIYKYLGQRNLNIHQLALPVLDMDRAQTFDFVSDDPKVKGIKFKTSPPGYYDKRMASFAK